MQINVSPKWSNKMRLVIYYYDSQCGSIQSDAADVEIEDAFINEASSSLTKLIII